MLWSLVHLIATPPSGMFLPGWWLERNITASEADGGSSHRTSMVAIPSCTPTVEAGRDVTERSQGLQCSIFQSLSLARSLAYIQSHKSPLWGHVPSGDPPAKATGSMLVRSYCQGGWWGEEKDPNADTDQAGGKGKLNLV